MNCPNHSERAFIPAATYSKNVDKPVISIAVNRPDATFDILVIKFLNGSSSTEIALLSLLIDSLMSLRNLITSSFSIIPEANRAPILDKADLILSIEPVNVSFAAFACSPNASYIASENV